MNEPLPAMPGPVRTWLLVYSRARRRQPWLRIVDVPVSVPRLEVLAALEQWRRWSAFAPGPSGRLTLVRLDRAGKLDGDPQRTADIGWDALAPERVRTTIDLPGEVHARVVQAARRNGQTQAAWMTDVIAQAAS